MTAEGKALRRIAQESKLLACAILVRLAVKVGGRDLSASAVKAFKDLAEALAEDAAWKKMEGGSP